MTFKNESILLPTKFLFFPMKELYSMNEKYLCYNCLVS